MLTGAVYTSKGLFVKQADKVMLSSALFHDLHDFAGDLPAKGQCKAGFFLETVPENVCQKQILYYLQPHDLRIRPDGPDHVENNDG